MAVLVTGGAGYIGAHMVLALLDDGEEVVVIDNLSTGFRWAVPESASFIEGDIGDESLLADVMKTKRIDAVIHFAGSIVVPDSVSDPLGYYHNNTVKSRTLIAAAEDSGVQNFIFSSTAAIFGNPETNPVNEQAAPNPMSPYGTSKYMTELMLRDTAAAHDLNYVALRYFNVAGADPEGRTGQSTPRATHLIKVTCEAALGQRSHMDVFGTDYDTPDGTCIRDYIHVTDLINAHAVALRYLRDGGKSDVFNCGYGKGFSVLQVIDAVKQESGKDFEVRYADRRPGDPAEIVAASDKIKNALGWTPRHDDLGKIVRHALNWQEHLKASGKMS